VRVHGQGADKYDNIRLGLTARLDTIQAAILIEKLGIFPEEIAARDAVARSYADGLGDAVIVPRVAEGNTSVWAQYTIRVPAGAREAFVEALRAQGVPTAIYYPKPLHRQTAYRHYPVADGGLPISDRLAGEVVSLPMHAYLDEPTRARIVGVVRGAVGK
jgi:dTDP-4-amino-4,6-dideoxygalactose transaminase